jgi:hypothetical protein
LDLKLNGKPALVTGRAAGLAREGGFGSDSITSIV